MLSSFINLIVNNLLYIVLF
ncbi:Protein of unknown function [Bacillus cereus]|nr:Protein of unknown function [Bacillus cereus]